MQQPFLKDFIRVIKKVISNLRNADWQSPKNIVLVVSAIIFPFIGWFYVSQGLVIALVMSASILWLLEKSPNFFKTIVAKFPFAADLFLSAAAMYMFGGYFGSGLVLGISAVFTALILSWGLTIFAERFQAEEKPAPAPKEAKPSFMGKVKSFFKRNPNVAPAFA